MSLAERAARDARPLDHCDPESDSLDRMSREAIGEGGDAGVRL